GTHEGVHKHTPRLDFTGDALTAFKVLCPNRTTETVTTRICHLYCLIFVFHRDQRSDRSKHLFVKGDHSRPDLVEQGRTEVASLTLTSRDEPCTGVNRLLQLLL